MEREAVSTDSTLTEGRAAVDTATRSTLFCVSSGNTLLTCLPGEGKDLDPSLCAALRHLFNRYPRALP